ncbi:MAG: leucyl aminopeptidase [Vicinamibacterales bacterium]
MSQPHPPVCQFSGVALDPRDLAVEILFIAVFEGETDIDGLSDVDAAVGGEWRRALESREFCHRPYEYFTARVLTGWKAQRVGFVAAGPLAELDAERLRRLAAACGYAARAKGAVSMGWVVRPGLPPLDAASIVADGFSAAEFDNGTHKSMSERPGPYPSQVVVVVPGADLQAVASAVARGRIVGESANLARSLANEPGNLLPPRELAARIAQAARAAGLSVEVLEEQKIRDLGMRLLLGVAQGSAEPPRLIVLRHEPAGAPASPLLALVGKGVTFDSGGISIKPADGMERMKDDMAGAAAVAGAMRALALLGSPYRVIGIIPSVENMPGGRATRPGDVVVGASGTSVEIINTDAEGRLILADALWYAQQLGATHIVDVATLTGACMVALGRTVSGLFGKPDSWVDTVKSAASRAGDRVWPMPIYEEAKEQLRSEIADLVNSAGRPGGAITAAAFLREFTGDRPWAHLDIAGTAWAESKKPYQPKGATGVAVRTLIELGMTAGRSGASRAD